MDAARALLSGVGEEHVDKMTELERRRRELAKEKAQVVKEQKLESRKRKRLEEKIKSVPTDELLAMIGARLAASAKAKAKAKAMPKAKAKAKGHGNGTPGAAVVSPDADAASAEGEHVLTREEPSETFEADDEVVGVAT